MLTRLVISNLATIDTLAVDLTAGFTVLTGETGAGKSILIDGLRFALGGKGAPDQVRSGTARTLVEAAFDVSRLPDVREHLQALEIPCDGELTVRRLLQESGRSRAMANDCAITQARLEEVGRYLVSIHGQHDNQMLLDPATHIDFLDAFGGLLPLRGEVAAQHAAYTQLVRERKALREQAADRDRRRAELAEVVEELRAADLVAEEVDALHAELTRLTHAEQLAALMNDACALLADGPAPVSAQLRDAGQAVAQAARLDPRLAAHEEQLQPLRIQVEELYQALHAYAAGLESEPDRLETVNTRLAEVEKVTRRHGGDVEAALTRLAEAEQELAALEEVQDTLAAMDARVQALAGKLHSLCGKLSGRRKQAARRLDAQVAKELTELGMQHAVFETSIAPLAGREGQTPGYAATGMDGVEFLLSANPGQPVRPLARIASGGELSRTMLALKTILAQVDPTGTLIFDEVDAGISGRMAEIVGRKLRELGESHQVLCVTHLPQIAALGSGHLRVVKHAQEGQTYTTAETLDDEAKVQEVARLLSGVEITPHSLASAAEMVSRGREESA